MNPKPCVLTSGRGLPLKAMCVCYFKYHWVKTACPKSIPTLQLSLPQNTTGSRGLDHEERGQAEGGSGEQAK